jgi:AcrR family transcriptional regulator
VSQFRGFRAPPPAMAHSCLQDRFMPRILTPTDVAEFRNRLCDVGAQLFAEMGFEGFNMRELAKRLGISAMTPYRYFKDKEAILAEVRVRAFARFADWLEEQLSAPDADDANALSRAYAQFAIQEQTQYRLMFDLNQPQSSVPPALAAQERRARHVLVAYARALAGESLVIDDPELLGLILWATLHGITALYLAGKLSSQDFNHALSHAARMFTLSVAPKNITIGAPFAMESSRLVPRLGSTSTNSANRFPVSGTNSPP